MRDHGDRTGPLDARNGSSRACMQVSQTLTPREPEVITLVTAGLMNSRSPPKSHFRDTLKIHRGT